MENPANPANTANQANASNSANPDSAWLTVRGLSKQFGGVRALSGVDLDIRRGEVHGLVGANGAGKSTLIRCLAGVTTPDEGAITVDGAQAALATPQDAEHAGLAFIHQELNLVPHFSSLENILLGVDKAKRFGMIDWKRSGRAAHEAAARIGVQFPLSRRVSELSVAEQWLVMISKALARRASMIAMDEPTASLSAAESERLFKVVRDLAADGVAILYVSHRLDEVLDLSDRITVFRDGRVTRKAVRGEMDKRGLIRAIVDREVAPATRATARERATTQRRVVFEARNVSRGRAVRDVSFQAFAGEVLGLGGLVGAGRTELARLAFGADRLEGGSFEVDGEPIDTGSVHAAVRAGVGMVPEERRSEGLMLEKSVSLNINITMLRSLRTVGGLPFVSRGKARSRSQDLVGRLGVRAAGVDQPIGDLSGGNQQKTLIARWLTDGLKVLFLDEPSRGVDIGAREEIHQVIRDLADSGVGVVVISSEVEELVMLCDRIVVMREGEVTGVVSGDEITEDRVIELSYTHPQSVQGASR
jgi:ribose transport system ATP-binding protein